MRGDNNERLTILSEAEKTALYSVPEFDDFQRIEFFAMTDAERSLALQRRGIVKQIYCLLQIGYFKAKQAFFQFPLDEVPPADVRWLMHGAARQGQVSPLDLSFTENVHLFRRAQPQSGAFPPPVSPRKRKRWFAQLLQKADSSLKCNSVMTRV
jgi:hypothetical protein